MLASKKIINKVYLNHINEIYSLKNDIEYAKEMISSTSDQAKQKEHKKHIKNYRAKIKKLLDIVKNQTLHSTL